MLHQPVTAAPVATPWHASPLCQQIIADLFTLEEMACRYVAFAREAGDKYPADNLTTAAIGILEEGGGWNKPRTWNAYSGLSRHLFDRLDGARDEWIDTETYRLAAERGISTDWTRSNDDGEAFDTLSDETRDAADTVNRAIDLAIEARNKAFFA